MVRESQIRPVTKEGLDIKSAVIVLFCPLLFAEVPYLLNCFTFSPHRCNKSTQYLAAFCTDGDC